MISEQELIDRMHIAFYNLTSEIFNYYGSCQECPHKICCTAIAPVVNKQEIRVLCNASRMNPSKFKKKYLKKFELQGKKQRLRAPCPFLKDGTCSVYLERPKACRIFPFEINLHIGIVRMEGIEICPIATLLFDEFIDFSERYSHCVKVTEEMEERTQRLIEASERVNELVEKAEGIDLTHESRFMIVSPMEAVCFYHEKVQGLDNIEEKLKEYQESSDGLIEFVYYKFYEKMQK